MADWKAEIRSRLAGLNLDGAKEAEIIEEISQHLEDRFAELRSWGITVEEAQRATLEELNGDELSGAVLRRMPQTEKKPVSLGQTAGNMFQQLVQDLRFGARQLRQDLGFTTVAVLSLALGIGASTGVFTALEAILMQGPPYVEPDRLFKITEIQTSGGAARATSPANLLVWQTATNVFTGISAYFGARDNGAAVGDSEAFLTGVGQPVRLKCLGVMPGLFELLGVKPLLGRSFTPEQLYDSTVVILSHGCWRSQFGSAPDIIGRSIVMGGQAKTVIGVMPPGFYFPSKEFQIYWTPGVEPGSF